MSAWSGIGSFIAKNPPAKRGNFSFGHSPNITDNAQVRFCWSAGHAYDYLLSIDGALGHKD